MLDRLLIGLKRKMEEWRIRLNSLPQRDVCVNHIERCLFVSAVRKKHSVSDTKVAKPENGLIQARGRLPQFENLKIFVDLHVYL